MHRNTDRGECAESAPGIQAGMSALKVHRNTGRGECAENAQEYRQGECAESAPEHRQG